MDTVVQHVREKFAGRSCEAVSQAPAPSHPIRRWRAGPNLLAMVLAEKYAQHLPLHRQSAAKPLKGSTWMSPPWPTGAARWRQTGAGSLKPFEDWTLPTDIKDSLYPL
ncbi:transposase [Niveispirillum sp. SYP-B3756]|nr:transposase [Niveispirillum sp. SYP-B3756]